jgi:Arc/MetJ-type ribon-helix-helix transcriptional regulator
MHYTNMEERDVIPVSLPRGLLGDIDELVEKGIFSSRTDVLRYGARLVVLKEKRRIHERAEDYAYDEIKEGIQRGRDVS